MGLGLTATEDGIRSWLSGFGPVRNVVFVREGSARAPVALVDMDIADAQAAFIVSRIQNYWHNGSLVSARLLLH
jgi:hypothetical protein